MYAKREQKKPLQETLRETITMSPKKNQEDTKQRRGTENLFFGLDGSPSPGSLVSFSFSSSLSSPASWDLDREEAWYPYRPSFPSFWPGTTAIGHKTLHRPPPAKKRDQTTLSAALILQSLNSRQKPPSVAAVGLGHFQSRQ